MLLSFHQDGLAQLESEILDLKGVVYKKELGFEAKLHTNGYAVSVNFGDIITYYKTRYYMFEIGVMGDPREQSQNKNLSFPFQSLSRSFKFGKQNSVIMLRGGIGTRKYLSEKAKRKGIAIGYNYEIGPTLALLKPYYLNLFYVGERDGQQILTLQSEKYSPENAAKFLNFNDIHSSAGYAKGFGEIDVVPGAQAKLGFFFSLDAFDEYSKTIEVGMMSDVFLRKIPIMVETESISNKPYFVNFYLSFHIGIRSN